MIRSILLAVDLNHESSWRKALPQAVALARADDAALHVITVIPDFGKSIVGSYFPEGFSEKALNETEAALTKLVAEQVPGDVSATVHVKHGTIYRKIIEAAGKLGCDLIVMASHRSEMKDYLIGPNAARVVRHAPQSVFVDRE
jgi:nucleotide-binding universal stress UspA family protein